MGIPVGSRILITGATGFLGGRAVDCLKKFYDITATDRDEKAGREYWKKGVYFVSGDLADPDTAIELCKGQDYVFNCAALSSPWGHFQDYYQSNVQIVSNLIDACEINGVSRLVHVSSSAVYSAYQDRENIKEVFLPDTFANSYASTKHLAEKLLFEACEHGFDAIILRPSLIFGPGDKSLFPRLLAVNEKSFIPIVRNGRVKTEITYVDNVVDAMILAASAPGRYRGRTYNITNDEPLMVKDAIDAMFKLTGIDARYLNLPYALWDIVARGYEWRAKRWEFKEPPLTRYTLGLFCKDNTLNIDRAKKELGYYARVSVDEGLDAFAHWWLMSCVKPAEEMNSADRSKLAEVNESMEYSGPYDASDGIQGA